MNEIYKSLGKTLVIITTIFAKSVVNGTLFYFIYPSIHTLFINAAENNIIAKEMSWWNCVCIVWICCILFKSINIKFNDKAE